jgi:hypothetical protein
MQDVTNPVSLPPFDCMQDIPVLLDTVQYVITSYTIRPTDILQYQISKLSRHFCSTFRSVQVFYIARRKQ